MIEGLLSACCLLTMLGVPFGVMLLVAGMLLRARRGRTSEARQRIGASGAAVERLEHLGREVVLQRRQGLGKVSAALLEVIVAVRVEAPGKLVSKFSRSSKEDLATWFKLDRGPATALPVSAEATERFLVLAKRADGTGHVTWRNPEHMGALGEGWSDAARSFVGARVRREEQVPALLDELHALASQIEQDLGAS